MPRRKQPSAWSKAVRPRRARVSHPFVRHTCRTVRDCAGMVESFNISVANALILYEAQQQRIRRLGSHADLSPDQQMALKAVMLTKTVVRRGRRTVGIRDMALCWQAWGLERRAPEQGTSPIRPRRAPFCCPSWRLVPLTRLTLPRGRAPCDHVPPRPAPPCRRKASPCCRSCSAGRCPRGSRTCSGNWPRRPPPTRQRWHPRGWSRAPAQGRRERGRQCGHSCGVKGQVCGQATE